MLGVTTLPHHQVFYDVRSSIIGLDNIDAHHKDAEMVNYLFLKRKNPSDDITISNNENIPS